MIHACCSLSHLPSPPVNTNHSGNPILAKAESRSSSSKRWIFGASRRETQVGYSTITAQVKEQGSKDPIQSWSSGVCLVRGGSGEKGIPGGAEVSGGGSGEMPRSSRLPTLCLHLSRFSTHPVLSLSLSLSPLPVDSGVCCGVRAGGRA